MGHGLSGAPTRRRREHSRILGLLSLAVLAAGFRLLLRAGRRPETPTAVDRTSAPVDRTSARPAPSISAVEPRRYRGTLGVDGADGGVTRELARLAGPSAWMDDPQGGMPEVATPRPQMPAAPVAVIDRGVIAPEVDCDDVAPEVELDNVAPLADEALVQTLAEIDALPEVEPRRPRSVGPARSRRPGWLTDDRCWYLALILIGALALALRLINHSTNYDVFIDEIEYSDVGRSIALGHGVMLFNSPFFLHPPLFLYLEAAVLELFGGAHASPIRLVLDLRPINCVIGAIEVVLLMQLVRRFTHRRAAVIVGLFVACDPFLLLWDGRVLLETLAMTLAVAGWLCLDWIARVRASAAAGAPQGTRGVTPMAILAGLCFGASMLSKETYTFVGFVPLLGMLVIASPLSRRITVIASGVAMACYGVYLATVALGGHLSLWWDQNFSLLQRAVGTKQVTGFNQAGHHASLGASVSSDLSLYLISYLAIAAIALAATAGVVRWIRAARAGRQLTVQRRLAIALGAGAVGYVGYAMVFGAFETQIFYMCVIGGLPVLATEFQASAWRRSRARLSRRTLVIGCALILSAALAFEVSVDVRLRTQKDTALSALVNYVATQVPSGAMVDSTDGVTQFLLQDVQIDGPTTVRGLQRDRPGYVVVDRGLVSKGYDNLSPSFERWLGRHAHVVFSTDGRSTGRLVLYETIYAQAGSVALR